MNREDNALNIHYEHLDFFFFFLFYNFASRALAKQGSNFVQ